MEELEHLTHAILNILAIFAGILGGLWAYTKYVIERGFLPAAQFDIECTLMGYIEQNMVLDIGIRLKNTGSALLVARWIFLDVLYTKEDGKEVDYFMDNRRVGCLLFPHSLVKDLCVDSNLLVTNIIQELKATGRKPLPRPMQDSVRGLPVLPYDTFVQPNVDQRYSFVTKLPKDAKFALVRASFEYAQKPKLFQNGIYRLSRTLGLIHYSLQHVNRPHTVERAFALQHEPSETTTKPSAQRVSR